MSTYRSQDLTKLSKIVSCDNETYKAMSNRVDPYYEMTMYLVNNGVNVTEESSSEKSQLYTDVYYGSRKVSDIIVVESYPGDVEYPNNKIYLRVIRDASKIDGVSGERLVVGYRIYFKVNDTVIPIASSEETSIISGVVFNDDGTITIKWISPDNTGTEKEVETKLVLADDNGKLPDSVIEELKEYLVSQIKDEVSVVWRHIGYQYPD